MCQDAKAVMDYATEVDDAYIRPCQAAGAITKRRVTRYLDFLK